MNTPSPTPAPLEIFRVETYADNRDRLIVAKYKHQTGTMFPTAPTFVGQGLAAVMTPQGPQQVPFEIPLPGPSIEEAFEQFDPSQESAFRVHLEKMRLAALKQGADLTQLPRADESRKR